jgi:hypothetical protein
MAEESFQYVPLGRMPEAAPEAQRPLSPSTRSSWVIALTPIALFAFDIWIAALLGGYITWRIVFAVAAVGIALTYVCALDDQRRLARLGFRGGTSPVIALACPTAYLFVRGSRAFRESYAGFRPAWIQLASFAVIVVVANFLLPLMVKLNEIHV